ncbi:endo-1,4-beta-xylanase [Brevundimonas sp.]|jgi:endo-1,4-beta-xylanase|uniref:endo-1,4-beta-xylanase n=1 Tax=Brevundimonas sp. TaxID=1871086 RepID=UPI002E12DFE2
MRATRRALLLSTLALAACGRAPVQAAPAAAPLKALAPAPVGVAVMSGQLDDTAWTTLARREISQLTPEWEMKMEYILAEDGGWRFDAPDRIAAFARANGMRLHGHALIWYSQGQDWFEAIKPARRARAFDDYIAVVAGRYRGQLAGWDVVNEAVAEDGDGLRHCHWSARFGQDGYIARAFEQTRSADPDAVLFLNDYNLENLPLKGATFLRLVERLLAAGAPITGIGTQAHLDIDIPAGQISAFMRDAAAFGLPIHVSELDAPMGAGLLDRARRDSRRALQTARVMEYAEAFAALPERQRYAFTLWGLRDGDSFVNRQGGGDSPLAFDDAGRPTALHQALVQGFGPRGSATKR